MIMEKKNYQLMLDRELEKIVTSGAVPRLLLHSCCAPCSSYVIEYLTEYFEMTVFYFNPNIYPEEEFYKRIDEQCRFIDRIPVKHPIHFIGSDYRSEEFYAAVKGHEGDPEGGERCKICYRLRLEETARLAAREGFDYFTTTLSISPHKNAEWLNSIGAELTSEYKVPWLFSDFKKRNGFKRSTELCREYCIYRQDYCGCVFSKAESERRRGNS